MSKIGGYILDLILLCAWLAIGCAMLVTCWSNMQKSASKIQQEDKTALRNYTGLVEDSFQYTGQDLLLATVIGDQYEPDKPSLQVMCTNSFTIDANAESAPLATNYVNEDRITYIQNHWNNQLKEYNNTNPISFTRVTDNTGEYIWCVTH